MPNFAVGNMFDAQPAPSIHVISTCGVLKSDGTLVMGAGIAKEACKRYSGLAEKAGFLVKSTGKRLEMGSHYLYGFLYLGEPKIGLLQTKYDWRDKADLALIGHAITEMQFLIASLDIQVSMNYPGIGAGGLTQEDVAPLLYSLDGRYTVWSLT